MARRLRRNAVPKTGTTLDYSHTNDRRQLGLAEPGDYILPLYLNPTSACAAGGLYEATSCNRHPGVGDGMEPNRPVACLLAKCHGDGRR